MQAKSFVRLLPLVLCVLSGCEQPKPYGRGATVDGGARAPESVVTYDVMAALDNLFERPRTQFRSAAYVETVNSLRRVGKEQALKLLRERLAIEPASSERHLKVALVCRLLFQAPKGGWKPPELGQPFPDISAQGSTAFPLFPLAISNGVPFMLVGAYTSVGVSFAGEATLRICETLPMITKDLATSGYLQAAQELVESRNFKAIYEDSTALAMMERSIVQQASISDP
jgi:hypothetical protein